MNKSVNELLEIYKDQQCDICEHLETLIKYAKLCNHITEFGMRTGVSTVAFLSTCPKKLITCDIDKHEDILNIFENYAIENQFEFEFIHANDLTIELNETDLLFIDTMHNYLHLKQELSIHGNKAKKYLIFHDTEIFGNRDDFGSGPGLLKAINEFLDENKHWKIKEIFTNNNGLMILERIK